MMTQTQADRVMKTLLDVYPRHGLSPDGIARYADHLIDSGAEYDRAQEIAKRWPNTHEFFPSLAELMAVVATRKYVVADPDDTEIHPDVRRRIQSMWRDALAAADKKAEKRGANGHYHGGPDPCSLCGGMKVAR